MKKNILLLLLLTLLINAGCTVNQAQIGSGLGALVGATAGALVSDNKLLGAAVGAGAGGLVGYIVGNELDKSDMKEISEIAETSPSNETHAWENPDTGKKYQAKVSKAYQKRNDERIYRNVTLKIDGKARKGTLVRRSNGEWEFVG